MNSNEGKSNYLNKIDIKLFMRWLKKKGLAIDTIYHKMSTLKTMLKDAYRDEDIRRVPPFPVLKRKTLTRPRITPYHRTARNPHKRNTGTPQTHI
jgi:hypothetical protein